MYLNIILTLIFIVFAGNLWANVGYAYRREEKQKVYAAKQENLNEHMIMLHLEMIKELKRINEDMEMVKELKIMLRERANGGRNE